jgi:hypothetical protein
VKGVGKDGENYCGQLNLDFEEKVGENENADS